MSILSQRRKPSASSQEHCPDLTSNGLEYPGTVAPDDAALNILYTVGKLDPVTDETAKVFIGIYPVGRLSPVNTTDLEQWFSEILEARITAPFTISTSYKTFSFKAGDRVQLQEQLMPINDAERYPLDDHSLTDSITATWIDPATNTSAVLPVTVIDNSMQQGWTFLLDPSDSTTISSILDENNKNTNLPLVPQPAWNYAVTAHRSTTTKVISFGIIALMWTLSLTYFIVGVLVVSADRKVALTVAALGAILMFGMNALRSVQPGVPLTGCIADTFGYMWNMSILAVCCVLAVGHYLVRVNRLPRVPAAVEEHKV
ncbi:uncharacterized protein EV422DRAFT_570037 [Fimicolochytrium jonesii]|uniref:uncharacterized protein n=1 Tax=Fimicolochytrium jonesii TaxID=1396493 RepID=UPI0022FE2252|nr:uncharacterized protein EV422DRAFT_570037 [Fimicolochytrium jonesii]KAI8818262.1 hypothetical protein EV422DRAFT_570037 [Fimicolochytrium jonesii]